MNAWILSSLLSALTPGSKFHERGPSPSLPPEATAAFPEDFLFGTAVAGFQVEMGCPSLPPAQCEDRGSDWYQFITDKTLRRERLLFIAGDSPSMGPGFYETYEQDLALARHELGVNSMRLSLEWSRIFPNPTFGISDHEALRQQASAEGLAYYHALLQHMAQLGIKPFVTINHYTLPLWIHDGKACHKNIKTCQAKGWVGADIVPELAKFAGFAAREFGYVVDHWMTLNEPFAAVVLPGYLFPNPTRTNPPGVRLKIKEARLAAKTMIEAHARMYDAVHEQDQVDADGDGLKTQVGLVNVFFSVRPNKPERAVDVNAADDLRYWLNEIFMNAVVNGELDENWNRQTVYRSDLQGRLDFVGLNYYASIKVDGTRLPLLKPISKLIRLGLKSRVDDNYPQGIYQVISEAAERYQLPIYITETGVDQARDEDRGARWLVDTAAWTRQAMADGYDVRGYFYWSLMDNYEWNHGMAQRFGLYAIEGDDPLKTRKPRAAVPIYGTLTRQRSLADVVQF